MNSKKFPAAAVNSLSSYLARSGGISLGSDRFDKDVTIVVFLQDQPERTHQFDNSVVRIGLSLRFGPSNQVFFIGHT
jgi:hypothetical protein